MLHSRCYEYEEEDHMNLKDDVLSRIVANNRARDWRKNDIEITLSDVRVVLLRE